MPSVQEFSQLFGLNVSRTCKCLQNDLKLSSHIESDIMLTKCCDMLFKCMLIKDGRGGGGGIKW